ncbi:MAG: hypothetical protein ACRD15_10025, partial [Vicinamibacterales bacterium]
SKQVFDWRKSKADEMKAQLENDGKLLTFSSQILQGVSDETSFQSAKRAIKSLWGDRGDTVASQLGEMFAPGRVKQVLAWGTARSDELKRQQDAIVNARAAWDLQLDISREGREREAAMIEAREKYQLSASQMLSTARSQEQWDQFQRLLSQGGVPTDILARFGNQFSPQAVERARALGMGPGERETVRHNRVTEGQRDRELTIRKQEADQNPQRDLNTRGDLTRRSTAERWKQDRFAEIEEAVAEIEDLHRPLSGMKRDPEYDGRVRAAIEELGEKKLQVEDSYRAQIGLGPILETEFELTRDPTKNAAAIRKLRTTYKSLTGKDSPLTRADQLRHEMTREKNSKKQLQMALELVELVDRFETDPGLKAKNAERIRQIQERLQTR